MALDAETEAYVRQARAAGSTPWDQMTPAQARAAVAGFPEHVGPGPAVERAEDVSIDVDFGQITLRVLSPADPRAVIVYFHGGGWLLGGLAMSDTLARTLAVRSGCVVVVVDYRLAPEHPFPTPVDDSWAAFTWVSAHVGELAGKDVPLLVLGDSSGGNLAAVVARRARDADIALALQVLAYPVTDCGLETPSFNDPDCVVMLAKSDMRWFWGHYIADEAARAHPDASPLRAADLSGVAPAVVFTAAHDVLRDEGEAYADRLEAAGVPVTRRRFEGQMHGFFNMINILPGAAAGMDYVVAGIDAALA